MENKHSERNGASAFDERYHGNKENRKLRWKIFLKKSLYRFNHMISLLKKLCILTHYTLYINIPGISIKK